MVQYNAIYCYIMLFQTVVIATCARLKAREPDHSEQNCDVLEAFTVAQKSSPIFSVGSTRHWYEVKKVAYVDICIARYIFNLVYRVILLTYGQNNLRFLPVDFEGHYYLSVQILLELLPGIHLVLSAMYNVDRLHAIPTGEDSVTFAEGPSVNPFKTFISKLYLYTQCAAWSMICTVNTKEVVSLSLPHPWKTVYIHFLLLVAKIYSLFITCCKNGISEVNSMSSLYCVFGVGNP